MIISLRYMLHITTASVLRLRSLISTSLSTLLPTGNNPLTSYYRTLCGSSIPTVKPNQPVMKYIDAKELAGMLKDEKLLAKRDYVVIDVRDEDRVGGHIIHSVHEPSADFLLNVDRLVRDVRDVPLVVFHCALSQMRGPKAARIYEETRNNLYPNQEKTQQIAILRDGFVGFQEKYKNDVKLVEGWDKDEWEADVVPLPENLSDVLCDPSTIKLS